jgi:hypothetical protein
VVSNAPVAGSPVYTPIAMAQVHLTYSFQPVVPIPLQGPISVSASSAAPIP